MLDLDPPLKEVCTPTRRLSSLWRASSISFNKEIKELSYVFVNQIGFLSFQIWVIAHAYFNVFPTEQLVNAVSVRYELEDELRSGKDIQGKLLLAFFLKMKQSEFWNEEKVSTEITTRLLSISLVL